MKKIVTLALLLIANYLAFSQNTSALIKGKVLTKDVKSVTVEWLRDNQIAGVQKTFSAPVDAKGEFTLTVPLQNFAEGRVKAGNFHHYIFLLPTDNFQVLIDGDNITYTGKGASKNSFLYALEKANYHKTNYYTDSNAGKLTPADFAKKLTLFRDTLVKLLTEFDKKEKLEQAFKEYFLADNAAIYMDQIIGYPERYAYYNKLKVVPKPADQVYNQYQHFKQIVNDKYVLSPTYISSLRNLVVTKGLDIYRDVSAKKDGVINGNGLPPKTNLWWAGAVKPTYQTISQSIMLDSMSGKTREYVMAAWLYSEYSRDKQDAVIYGKFKAIAKDPLAISTVDNAYAKYQFKRGLLDQPLHAEFNNSMVEDSNGKEFPFSALVDKYKGKVIYLDMWDLACAPCRAEMPYAKNLKEKLKDESVEFVYLTLDEKSPDLWEKVYKVTLTDQNQYRLQNRFESRLYKFMEMNWVPSYMIIDKEGKLVDYAAPRPSQQQLEKKLLELAKK